MNDDFSTKVIAKITAKYKNLSCIGRKLGGDLLYSPKEVYSWKSEFLLHALALYVNIA